MKHDDRTENLREIMFISKMDCRNIYNEPNRLLQHRNLRIVLKQRLNQFRVAIVC